jgi:ankyrin repeat protein
MSHAVNMGSIELMQVLLKRGANIERSLNYDPLGVVVERGDYNAARLLIQAGAKVDRHVFLRGCSKWNEVSMAELLMAHYEDDEDVRDIGALHEACRARGYTYDVVSLFLSIGFDIEARSHGDTPLLSACTEGGNAYLVQHILLKRGANIHATSGIDGDTPCKSFGNDMELF